jgi:Domain of unknown function (DUF4202)
VPNEALFAVLAAIDKANAADPNSEPDGRPAALVYCERMSEELRRRSPRASEHLQIAARGQHIERLGPYRHRRPACSPPGGDPGKP